MHSTEAQAERLRAVRLLVLDVDGVLTDGRLYYGAAGEELKVFHVKDGLGLRLVRNVGIEVAVITARGSEALAARMRDLRIDRVLTKQDDKKRAFATLLADTGLLPAQCAYVGDDVIDLPVMRQVGVSIAVADAHPLVRNEAQMVTQARGGDGAVREICDALLAAKGGLERAVENLLSEGLMHSPKEQP